MGRHNNYREVWIRIQLMNVTNTFKYARPHHPNFLFPILYDVAGTISRVIRCLNPRQEQFSVDLLQKCFCGSGLQPEASM